MNEQHYDKLIDIFRMILLYYGSLAAVIIAVGTISKERSVGKTALNKQKEEHAKLKTQLMDEHAKVKSEIDAMKREHSDLRGDVERVEGKYENLIQKILNNFPFK